MGLQLCLRHVLHRGVCSPLLALSHRSSCAIHMAVDLLQPQLLSLFLLKQVPFIIHLFPPLPISPESSCFPSPSAFPFHSCPPVGAAEGGFAHSSHWCPSGVHVPHLHQSPGRPWPGTAALCSRTSQALPHSSSQEKVLFLGVSLT